MRAKAAVYQQTSLPVSPQGLSQPPSVGLMPQPLSQPVQQHGSLPPQITIPGVSLERFRASADPDDQAPTVAQSVRMETGRDCPRTGPG